MDAIDDRILLDPPDGRADQQRRARGATSGFRPRPACAGCRRSSGSGVIRGYRAVLDGGRLGVGFTAFLAVGLSQHTKVAQEAFERAMARAPEVVECHNVTGTVEYLLRVEVADLVAYKAFHSEVLGTLPQVTSITTYVVIDSPKDGRA